MSCVEVSVISLKTKLKIFDRNIKNVLLYGCEVWHSSKEKSLGMLMCSLIKTWGISWDFSDQTECQSKAYVIKYINNQLKSKFDAEYEYWTHCKKTLIEYWQRGLTVKPLRVTKTRQRSLGIKSIGDLLQLLHSNIKLVYWCSCFR